MGNAVDEFSGFDPHQPDVRVGAEQMWSRMRACPGLAHSDQYGGFHIVTRFDDVMRVVMEPDHFDSGSGITMPPARVRTPHIPAEIDPPEHRDYRNMLMRFLTPQMVRGMEGAVRRLAVELLDQFAAQTHVDFVEVFARPFPVHASLELLGLPGEDADHLDGLVRELHEEVATGVSTGGAQKLTEYVTAKVVERSAATDPDADIMSAIVLGKVGGRPLTIDEQVSTVRLVMIGGFDSTAIAVAMTVWWLAEHPEDAQRLRADPALIETAVDEFVRFSSPASYLRRGVAADIELGGCPLHKGEQVLISFAAANRDPAKFDRPDEVVLDRAANAHLGFGAGVHRCPGLYFARLELRIAIEEVLRRYRTITVDPDRPIRIGSGLNQGIVGLPLILDPFPIGD